VAPPDKACDKWLSEQPSRQGGRGPGFSLRSAGIPEHPVVLNHRYDGIACKARWLWLTENLVENFFCDLASFVVPRSVAVIFGNCSLFPNSSPHP